MQADLSGTLPDGDATPQMSPARQLPSASSLVTSSDSIPTVPGKVAATLPFTEWEVEGDHLEVCRNDDGTPVTLGQGSFGTVMLSLCHLGLACTFRAPDRLTPPQSWPDNLCEMRSGPEPVASLILCVPGS